MARRECAILAVDEGTSGTRAALVGPDGSVSCANHRPLRLLGPGHGLVEQDADAILEATVDVCRRTIAEATARGIEIAAIALATQRATAVLWDKRSGRALVPAMVWQDVRHAGDLARLAPSWNERLLAATGRPVGMRSPFLWAARHIAETPAVGAAWSARGLAFGTIDTWLLWHLSEARRCVTTATNAAPTGAYRLAEHDCLDGWLAALGFPAELLPQVLQEADDFGHWRRDLLGIRVPIRASCGDQTGGIVGLGCLDPGHALCVHGTGSFFHLMNGPRPASRPGLHDATVTTPAWRRGGRSEFAVETYVPATGSALDWMSSQMRWFDGATEASALAAGVASSEGLAFLPALTGLRLPVLAPDCRGALTGLSMAHGRAHVARAALEGIAHSVVSCAEACARSAERPLLEVIVGGGLSASDVLLQMQADLGGVPLRRLPASEHATLRGAAFLAGADGLFWDGLADACRSLPPGEWFLPKIGEDERLGNLAGVDRARRSEVPAWRLCRRLPIRPVPEGRCSRRVRPVGSLRREARRPTRPRCPPCRRGEWLGDVIAEPGREATAILDFVARQGGRGPNRRPDPPKGQGNRSAPNWDPPAATRSGGASDLPAADRPGLSRRSRPQGAESCG